MKYTRSWLAVPYVTNTFEGQQRNYAWLNLLIFMINKWVMISFISFINHLVLIFYGGEYFCTNIFSLKIAFMQASDKLSRTGHFLWLTKSDHGKLVTFSNHPSKSPIYLIWINPLFLLFFRLNILRPPTNKDMRVFL